MIHVGARLADIAQYLPDRPLVIITDKNLKAHYGRVFPEAPVISIGTGEAVKTLTTVEFILKQLMELGCDRSVFILGIGGGIVCDIAGFVASIFMRGVDFGFVSTSLLSQVDASVGGKNGVNVSAFKNMAGVFNQPRFVVCDPTMLHTLPSSEVSNGLAEIVKHALIADAGMLTYIEKNRCKALNPGTAGSSTSATPSAMPLKSWIHRVMAGPYQEAWSRPHGFPVLKACFRIRIPTVLSICFRDWDCPQT